MAEPYEHEASVRNRKIIGAVIAGIPRESDFKIEDLEKVLKRHKDDPLLQGIVWHRQNGSSPDVSDTVAGCMLGATVRYHATYLIYQVTNPESINSSASHELNEEEISRLNSYGREVVTS